MKRWAASLATLLFSFAAYAVPNLVNYQGTLLDNNNIPVTQANVPIIISIWDDATSTATANRKYQENHTVNVDDGVFSLQIGSGSSAIGTFNPALFDTAGNLFLQLNINGEDLLPRVRFLTAPYTMQSENSARFGNQLPTFYATASALSSLQSQVNALQIPSAETLCKATYGSVWVTSQSLCVGGASDLSNKDLTGETLSTVRLRGANLSGTKLSNAVIWNAFIQNVTLNTNSLFDGVAFLNSTIDNVDFSNISLATTGLNYVFTNNLIGCPTALPANWSCIQYSTAPVRYRLVGPYARFANDADLNNIMWQGTVAAPVMFPSQLQGVNFSENLFRYCMFPNNVNFTNANLYGAKFVGCTFGDGVTWSNTICPDGSKSSDSNNAGTCFGHGVTQQASYP